MRSTVPILALFTLGVSAAASCTTTTTVPVCGQDEVATTATDIVTVTDYESGFFFATADALPVTVFVETPPTAPANAAAAAAAAAVNTYFLPVGCATATAADNVVRYTFNNCGGPLGLTSGVTGTLVATFNTTTAGPLQIILAGTNIAVNNAVLNIQATGMLTVSGTTRTLDTTSTSSGTGPNGNNVARSASTSIVWTTGGTCATINGTGTSTGAGGAQLTTVITNYMRCRGVCPTTGIVTSTLAGDGSVTLSFNGSNTAQCTSSVGTSAGIALNCP